ncbi:MAG: hypothetical protein H6738_01690 [Alphaproteobacteria bacterium]|nr:hypothetical protein [Alphaproteobacteria bacterium]MCB9695480.1 hypothetical protein [Alphaproteobacteria bacterium]
MLIAWTLATARAGCPLSADDIVAASERSASAIAADDAPEHAKTFTALLRDLHCLEEELPREAWARLLLDEAIVSFAEGRDHRTVLAAAHRADPELAIPSFLARTPPSTELFRAPGTLRWPTTVDGVRVEDPVRLEGVHVVQATTGRGHLTWVVDDGRFPEDALGGLPAVGKVRVSTKGSPWGVLTTTGGWAETADRVADGDPALTRGGLVGLAAFGHLTLAGPLGASAELGSAFGDGALASGRLALTVGTDRVWGWAGGAVVSLRQGEDELRRTFWLPQPMLGVAARSPGDRALDGSLGFGVVPGTWNVDGRIGVAVVPVGPLDLRVGAAANVVTAAFVQEVSGVGATASRWSGGLELGVATR